MQLRHLNMKRFNSRKIATSICCPSWFPAVSSASNEFIFQQRRISKLINLPALYQSPVRHFHTTKNLSATAREKEKLSIQFTKVVQLLTKGLKAVYDDLKQLWRYRTKYGRGLTIQRTAPLPTEEQKTDLLYTREEVQFIYRVIYLEYKRITITPLLKV